MLINLLYSSKSEIYNVGGESTLTIKDLAQEISDILSVPIEFDLSVENFLNAPKVVKLNINKYLTEFQKKDFVGIRTGISETIKWQEENLYRKDT